jgi:single-strand DNA-binding protein
MNQVVLIGRLTRDPETSYTPSQMAVCRFTLAVDRPRRKDGEQGADFIQITVWDRQAENCNRYLAKGRQVAVQGRIQTGSYTNRDGQKVYTTDVVANNVEFLGSANSENPRSNGFNTQNNTNYQSQPQNAPQPQLQANLRIPDDWGDIPVTYSQTDEQVPF